MSEDQELVEEDESRNKRPVQQDALRLLMLSSLSQQTSSHRHHATKRKRKSSSSTGSSSIRFVLCPAGCGNHVAETSINLHLDRCIRRQEDQESTIREEAAATGVPLGANNRDERPILEETKEEMVQKNETLGGVLDPQLEKAECEDSGSSRVLDGGDPVEIPCHEDQKDETTIREEFTAPEKTLISTSSTAASTGSPPKARITPEHGGGSHRARPPPAPVPIAKSNGSSKSDGSTGNFQSRKGSDSGPNAFSRMMERSKVVFAAENGKGSLQQQCVHLSNDGTTVRFHPGRNRPDGDHYRHQDVVWSAKLTMKNKAQQQQQSIPATTDTAKQQRRPVELTITTSYPPRQGTAIDRLVRSHSRLSVPVLKSVLQKAIRRRRPLPAVRVAMELADKSLGDLLRRLPIIVLEDSTLHPDLPFLVWLMIAESKGFQVPKALFTIVMRIVYEIASCPWSDRLPSDEDEEVTERNVDSTTEMDSELTLSSLGDVEPLPDGFAATDDGGRTAMLWAILARKEYGGMKCDIRMLDRYGCLWRRRFQQSVPEDVAARILPRESPGPSNSTSVTSNDDKSERECSSVPWVHVPARIHARAKAQSLERVDPLCARGLDRLCVEDVCAEGVDFHCSSVVDHLLSLPLAGICADLLHLSGHETVPTSPGDRRSYLEKLFKHCMWHFSSGANRRQPLLPVDAEEEEERVQGDDDAKRKRKRYEDLWHDLLAGEATAFQTNYVLERLAR